MECLSHSVQTDFSFIIVPSRPQLHFFRKAFSDLPEGEFSLIIYYASLLDILCFLMVVVC